MTHTTVWTNRGAHWEFRGEITSQKIVSANAEFYEDHHFESAKYQLVDLTMVGKFEFSDDDLEWLFVLSDQ